MPSMTHRLVNAGNAHLMLVTAAQQRSLHDYQITIVQRYGQPQATYIDAKTGLEIFKNCYFDDAGEFVDGYAPVVKNGRYYHITITGKVAYRWRFTDIGHPDAAGVVLAQHPRAHGWSRFHIPSGTFLDNPPRYRY